MDELRGKLGRLLFDGDFVWIGFVDSWRNAPLLRAIGEVRVPVAAISSVDFRTGAGKLWHLRLRLRHDADPYALVGGRIKLDTDPFRLSGPVSSELLAEYYADQIRGAVALADVPDSMAEVRALIAPPVPLHIQVAEGVAGFDGGTVRLEWSGHHAGLAKKRERAREFALTELERVLWTPGNGGDYGYLRLIGPAENDQPPVKPSKDFTTIRTQGDTQDAQALMIGASIAARLGPRPSDQPAADNQILATIRELGRLRDEGLLSQAEFDTKKQELLDRL